MKLGEIKIEALKLMFAGNGVDFSIDDLDGYMKYDEDYKDYLYNMPGAINRSFSVIEGKGVLPLKSYTLEGDGRFNLSELIPDFYDLERIVYEGNGEYEGACEHFREGNSIIIRDYDESGEYRVLYRPKIQRITSGTDEKSEIDIPDNIACHIPYFIKGELFRVDEPDEAAEARNWFEAAIAEVKLMEEGRQARVTHKYSFGEV